MKILKIRVEQNVEGNCELVVQCAGAGTRTKHDIHDMTSKKKSVRIDASSLSFVL
jgi:hypothetical protein